MTLFYRLVITSPLAYIALAYNLSLVGVFAFSVYLCRFVAFVKFFSVRFGLSHRDNNDSEKVHLSQCNANELEQMPRNLCRFVYIKYAHMLSERETSHIIISMASGLVCVSFEAFVMENMRSP